MMDKRINRPKPRDLFERKIHHQFGLSGAVLRTISELRYPGKS